METVLWFIAGVSTALFVIRLVLMLIGIDGHDAADVAGSVDTLDSAHAAGDAADFKIFTLMTLLVTLMIGSWTVLLLNSYELAPWISLIGGYSAGFVGGVAVSYAMYSMRKLEADGTIRDFDAVGLKGTCYVKIPESGKGKGQVQVTVKGRLRTYDAVSDGPEIPSFQSIVVMSRVDSNLLRVCATE
jgi:hypothetical protein